MTTDIKELRGTERLIRLDCLFDGKAGCACSHCEASDTIARLAAERDRLAGEVAEALPWKLFYKGGLDLEQIGKRLGKSPYDFSPWLYAPLISQLKDREKTALADLAAERDRLKAAASLFVNAYTKAHPMRTADFHSPGCACIRCAFDAARKALGDAS